jgi:hypothetical protein
MFDIFDEDLELSFMALIAKYGDVDYNDFDDIHELPNDMWDWIDEADLDIDASWIEDLPY